MPSTTSASRKYNEKAYDRLYVTIPKGKKAVYEAHAMKQSESLNGFVNRAINNQIAYDNTGKNNLATQSPPSSELPTTEPQNKLHAAMMKEHANKPASDAPAIDYKSDKHLRNKFEWVLSDEEIKEATPEWESWQGSMKARYLHALKIRGYIKEEKEMDEEPDLPLSVRMAQDGRLQATAKEMEKDREVNVEEVSKVRVKFR